MTADDWKISRYIECDGTVRLRVPAERVTFAEARTIAQGFLEFLDAQDPPPLPPPPRAGTTTSELAAAMLTTAASTLQQMPDQVIQFCRENGVNFGTPQDMAVATLGLVGHVLNGGDVTLVDDAVGEGD